MVQRELGRAQFAPAARHSSHCLGGTHSQSPLYSDVYKKYTRALTFETQMSMSFESASAFCAEQDGDGWWR